MVVYTAVFGGYDDPPVVHEPDPALTYLFFTEDEHAPVPVPWERRAVPRAFEDPQRDARRVKLLPHLFVNDYEVSVWVDANCDVLKLDAGGVLDLLGDADYAVPSHGERACVYEESEAVLELGLDYPALVAGQMARYRSLGLPQYWGLHATMFLVRRHQVQAARQFSDAWWRELQSHSKRDQLSFDFVRWRSEASVKSLSLGFANSIFRWNGTHKLPRPSHISQETHLSPASAGTNGAKHGLAKGVAYSQGKSMEKSVAERVKSELATRGYAQPVPVFSAAECRWLMGVLEHHFEKPAQWYKGWAVSQRSFYDVAVDWRILSHVRSALGDNVVLWGASLVHRMPGEVHPWHSDIESSAPTARTVSVWIGLQGTCEHTSLKMAPGSHEFGATVQEKAAQKGRRRNEITDEDIAAWVKECGAREEPELVPMHDGEALFFDGRIWHGSNNLSPHLSRTALLLQYAAVDTPIRMPVQGHCEWPFKFLGQPWPPCLLMSGRDGTGINRITRPPMLPDGPEVGRLRSGNHHAPSSPLVPGKVGWNAHHFFRGYTAGLADVICHMSVLSQGKCPHPPFQHPEEEILVVLEGEVEVHHPTWEGRNRFVQRAGEVAYYPAGFYHTLTTTSEQPAKYLMLRWISDPSGEIPPLDPGVFTSTPSLPGDETKASDATEGWRHTPLMDGATSYLSKLHGHVTIMEPGAGYDPHVDDYDVILIVLEGEVSCFGGTVSAGGVIVCVAGEPHGLKNTGSKPARYIALEFHTGRMMKRRLLEEGVVVD
ncbi:cupin domain-containing protein [Roseimicrobium sp. ORNL1]|uniref:cupin domain-containing protein n=1 Tax=Roseimicrobium sp. ORNL1 TaxID=2711231 RepID=UPI0013E1350D|nr:cupin domain-containing protein [Roseimicrobium sp. ORNL1]QIF01595.1 cupin domain-containing protein [Roseimicrobium sp. ORNL1]